MHKSIVQSDNWNCQTNALILYTHAQPCRYTPTHTQAHAGPPGEATVQCSVVLGLLGLLGDVSMETVMSDLQTCALPSIWLRLANQITSTDTQMNRQISSWMKRIFRWFLDRYVTIVLNKFVISQCRIWFFFSSSHKTYGSDFVFICTLTGML